MQVPEFKAMIRSLAAGKTTITILYCQDGFPESWRETDEKRLENPAATSEAFWDYILRKVAPHVRHVNMVDFSFRCHPHDHADALGWLQMADLFYIRGTGQGTFSALVDISDDPSCFDLVVALQYEVLQNRLVYVGVCGAAQWAGDYVQVHNGGMRRGLQLFGRGFSVQYPDWRKATIPDPRVIEINAVNFCVVDTVLERAVCAVMCNKKNHNSRVRQEYFAKSLSIQKNLDRVLEALRGKKDLWRCTVTGFFLYCTCLAERPGIAIESNPFD